MKGMSNTYAWVFGNIRVDPTDENTIYTLALGVSVSRDGGKTFGAFSAAAGPPAGLRAGAAGGACAARAAAGTRRQRRRRQPRDVDRSQEHEVHAERQRQRLPRDDRRRSDVAPRQPADGDVLRHRVRHGHAVPRVRIGAGSRQLPRGRRSQQRPREPESDSVRGRARRRVLRARDRSDESEHRVLRTTHADRLRIPAPRGGGRRRWRRRRRRRRRGRPEAGPHRSATRTSVLPPRKATIRCACRCSRRSCSRRSIPTPSTSARSISSARTIAATRGKS